MCALGTMTIRMTIVNLIVMVQEASIIGGVYCDAVLEGFGPIYFTMSMVGGRK